MRNPPADLSPGEPAPLPTPLAGEPRRRLRGAGRSAARRGAPRAAGIRLVLAAILTAGLAAVSAVVATDSGSAPTWSSDVEQLVASIQSIHPDPYRHHSPDVWAAEAERVRATIDELEPHLAVLELHRLLALAGDGHTEPASLHPALGGPWFPMLVRRFDDGWFLRTAHRDLSGLFGKRLVSLAGMKIEQVAARVRPFVSADNEIGALDGIGNFVRLPAVLHAAGVTPQLQTTLQVEAADADGRIITAEVRANDDRWVTAEWLDADSLLTNSPKPLYRTLDRNYELHYLEANRVAYVGFESIRDEEDESIAEFFARVFELVAARPVDKLVLDLRENSGGNLDLNPPVLHGVLRSEIDRPGHLFVIVGRDTYSAAMNLAVLLERHTHALFVGEPTGSPPNHFGDTVEIELPASGLVVEISELYWQNSDPRDARPWIAPDLPAPLTSEQFFGHRDPAMDAVLAFRPSRELMEGFGPPVGRWRRKLEVGIRQDPPGTK